MLEIASEVDNTRVEKLWKLQLNGRDLGDIALVTASELNAVG